MRWKTTRDGLIPISDWMNYPVECSLTNLQWCYLSAACKVGVVPHSKILEWCKKCFSGIAPSWVWAGCSKGEEHTSVWSDLRSMLASKPKTIKHDSLGGHVYFNAANFIRSTHPKIGTLEAGGVAQAMILINFEQRCKKIIDKLKSMSRKRTKHDNAMLIKVQQRLSEPFFDLTVQNELLKIIAKKISKERYMGKEGNTFSKFEWAFIDFLYPSCSAMLKNRQLVTPRLAVMMLTEQKFVFTDVYQLLSGLRGVGSSAFCNFVVAYMSRDEWKYTIIQLMRKNLFSYGLEFLGKLLKEMHTKIRLTTDFWCPPLGVKQHFENYHMGMYMHILIGRYTFPGINIGNDVADRAVHARPKMVYDPSVGWSTELYDDVCTAVINESVEPFVQGKSRMRNWKKQDVVARLRALGTSGAASELRKYTISVGDKLEKLDSPTKTAWVSMINEKTISDLLASNVPQVHGRPVPKYESGKLRLLLPGPIQQWLIESVCLWGSESSVYRDSNVMALETSGLAELAQYTIRLAGCAADNSKVNSDFKDHNILHTYADMKKMWLTYAQALDPYGHSHRETWSAGVDFPTFCGMACRWAAASLSDVAASTSTNGGELLQLVRGLWSGWRSTTFINTLFNEVYTRATCTSFRNAYGSNPLLRWNILGDDMEGNGKTEWHAMRYLEMLDVGGFDAAAEKQLVTHNRTEFLRLMYEDGVIVGSLARAIAGFTSSDGQTTEKHSGPDTASTIYEAVGTLKRRGIMNSEKWEKVVIKYWGKVTAVIGGVERTIDIPDNLMNASKLDGGLGLSDEPKKVMRATVPLSMPPVKWNASEFTNQFSHPVSSAAINVLVRKLRAQGMTLDRPDLCIKDHAKSCFESSLPRRAKNTYWGAQRVAWYEWYTAWADNSIELGDSGNVALKMSGTVDLLLDDAVERATLMVPFLHSDDPNKLAEQIIAIALDPAGGEAALAARVERGGSTMISRMIDLGGQAAARKISSLVLMVGEKATEKMLTGKLSLIQPLMRGSTSVHNALLWPCLSAVFNVENNFYRECVKKHGLIKTVYDAARIVNVAIMRHKVWGPQMRF